MSGAAPGADEDVPVSAVPLADLSANIEQRLDEGETLAQVAQSLGLTPQSTAPVLATLGAQTWGLAVEQSGAEELLVQVESLDAAEGHLVATLAAAGARVIGIVPSGADLERVFLELTA